MTGAESERTDVVDTAARQLETKLKDQVVTIVKYKSISYADLHYLLKTPIETTQPEDIALCLVYHIDFHAQKVRLDTAKTHTRKIIRTKKQKEKQTAMETKANGQLPRCPRHPSALRTF